MGARGVALLLLLAVAAPLTRADTAAPYFIGGYPHTQNVLGTTLGVAVQLNEAGTVYYTVVPSGTPAPTSAQVVSGGAFGGVSPVATGSISVAAASTTYNDTVSGLSEKTMYDLYFVADDAAANLQAGPTKVDERTADESAPVFDSGYPMYTDIEGEAFTLNVKMDEAGTFYFAVVEYSATSTPPTVADIMAGTVTGSVACSPSSGVAVQEEPYHADTYQYRTAFSVQGVADKDACLSTFYGLSGSLAGVQECSICPVLKNETVYDVYIVAKDDEGLTAYYRTDNVQSSATNVALTTADTTPPRYTASYPKITNLLPTQFEVSVSVQESGTAYYVVMGDNSTAPNGETIKDIGAAGVPTGPYLAAGSFALSPSTPASQLVSGLQDETPYDVFVVVEDDGNDDTATNVYKSSASNLQSNATLINVLMPDGTPPVFVGTYTPVQTAVTGTAFDVTVQLDEPATVYYAVALASFDDSQVGDNGENTIACGTFTVSSAFTNTTISIASVDDPSNVSACNTEFYGVTTEFCSNCPLIESETRLKVFFRATDANSNTQTTRTRLMFYTTDITAPTYTSGTPEVSANVPSIYSYSPNPGGVTLNITTTLDEPGRSYAMALPISNLNSNLTMATFNSSHSVTGPEVRSCYYPGFDTTRAPNDFVSLDLPLCVYWDNPKAGVPATVSLKSLLPETLYYVFVASEDDEDLRQSSVTLLVNPPLANTQLLARQLNVTTADISPPSFESGYPEIPTTALTGTSMDVEVVLNEPGFCYVVVMPQSFVYNSQYTDGSARSVPTNGELTLGLGPGGVEPTANSSAAVTTAGSVTTIALSGLSSETEYVAWIICQDDDHAGDYGANLMEAPVSIDFKTRDVTAPTFSTGYPSTSVGGTNIVVNVRLDEQGEFYAVALASGSSAPNSASVKSPSPTEISCSSTVGGPDTDAVCVLVGLTSETAYDVYVVAEDHVDQALTSGGSYPTANIQSSPTQISVTMDDVSPPVYLDGTPSLSNLIGHAVDLNMKLDEAGTVYFVALPRDEPAPTSAEIRTGSGAAGSLAAASGSFDCAASTPCTGTVSPLSSHTHYKLYVTAADAEATPNVRRDIEVLTVRTPDITPPSFVGAWTGNGTSEHITGYSFDVVLQLDEPGKAFFVVVAKGDPAPSAAEVRGLRASGDTEPLACGSIDVADHSTNFTGAVVGVNATDNADCFDGFYGMPVLSGPAGPTDFYGLGGNYCLRCPHVSSEKEYDVYIVAEDDGGHATPAAEVPFGDRKNLQSAPSKTLRVNADALGPSVRTADVTPPKFVEETPYISALQGTGFNLTVALDEPGEVIYMVTQSNDPPNHYQLTQALNGSYSGANAYGTIVVPQANEPVTVVVGGLGRETRYEDQYRVYLFAKDDEPSGMTIFEDRFPASCAEANGTNVTGVCNRAPMSVPNMADIELEYAVTVDALAPVWSPGYPKVVNLVSTTGLGNLTTTFDVLGNMDEPGRLYYVAFEVAPAGSELPGSHPPTAAQVRAGQDYQGNAAAVNGMASTSSSFTDFRVTTGQPLTDSTDYVVYIVAEDDTNAYQGGLGQTGANVQSEPVEIFITTADGTAPLFYGNPCASRFQEECTSDLTSFIGLHSAYPVTKNHSDGFELVVSLTEDNSFVYYVGIDAADLKPGTTYSQRGPTKSQVVAGGSYYADGQTVTPIFAGYISVPKANTTYSAVITRPNAQNYFTFVATVGPAGNYGDGDVKRETLRRSTMLTPYLMDYNFVVKETTIEYDSVFMSGSGKLYIVVLVAGAPAPTPTQIIYGYDSQNNTAGCRNVTASDLCYFADTSSSSTFINHTLDSGAATGLTLETTNLTRGTLYDLYYVIGEHPGYGSETAQDVDANGDPLTYHEFSRQVGLITVRTPDETPPYFRPGFPYATEVRGNKFMLVAECDEAGTLYYVLLPGGSSAPSSAQVKAGTDASGAGPLQNGTLVMPHAQNPAARVTQYNLTIGGALSPETFYDLYIVVEDDETTPNLQALPTKLYVRTASTDTRMANISHSNGLLVPAFDKSVRDYRLFLQDGESSFSLTPSVYDLEAASGLKLNGSAIPNDQTLNFTNLKYGKTVYEFNVTAGDGVTEGTYTLTVHQQSNATTSNATLSEIYLVLSDGTVINSTMMGGAPWPACVKGCTPLSPSTCSLANPSCILDGAQTSYVARIQSGLSHVDVYALAKGSDAGATIKMYTLGTKGVDYPGGLPGFTTGTLLSSNNRVSLLSLMENGGDTIDLRVTAGDNTTTLVYTIRVEQYGPGIYPTDAYKPYVASSTVDGKAGSVFDEDPLTTMTMQAGLVQPLTVAPHRDIEPPEFLTSYPRAASASSTSAELVAQINEPGVVYFLILPPGARAPTAREMVEPWQRSDAVLNGTIADSLYSVTRETRLTVSGLVASTTYDVYFLAEDNARRFDLSEAPNAQAAATLVSMTTPA